LTILIVLAVWRFIEWRMQPPPPPLQKKNVISNVGR
jgi:hypothetical protein